MDNKEELYNLIESLSEDAQRALLARLRELYPIHKIEAEWGVPAEVILEAIARSSDLSQRGVRGLIAEAYFEMRIMPMLAGWKNDTPPGNHAYDFRLRRDRQLVTIQVKNQRRKSGRPMMAHEAYRWLPADAYVVETQKTRAGTDAQGLSTRPYRFGEFDILAVNMEPATGDWTQFRYTLEKWLLPSREDGSLILKFQPVPLDHGNNWTDDLAVALDWFVDANRHGL